MACALTGILPTLACNAANNRWGVVRMGWRERRGGRHEVGMGASSWDARLEHGGTIWQGTSSIFSRIFTALLSPLPSTKKHVRARPEEAEYRRWHAIPTNPSLDNAKDITLLKLV